VETLVEESRPSLGKSKSLGRNTTTAKPTKLSEIPLKGLKRISTKISELDRVLGGGVVPGQVILLAGEPGVGKSTILLQVAQNTGRVLYATGEESTQQVKIRAQRLGVANAKLLIFESIDVDEIVDAAKDVPDLSLLIVDSIQTVATGDLTGLAGSVGQVRESAFRLLRFAKSRGIPLYIVGHVTKEGTVAGPAVLAHIVDTVIWFEGDKTKMYRVLRAVKNRFGPTDEVGIFTMIDKGLSSVTDASKIFLSTEGKPVAGSVVTSTMEGTRPILVEVQSLVVPTKLPFPKRVSQGIDQRRLELLLAVLTRRVGVPLGEFDCFVNIVGGLSIKDPGVDLAVCLSLLSAYFDKPLPKGTLAIGEVGLLGEVRPTAWQEKVAKDARRQGYANLISNKEFKYLSQAVKKLFQ